MTKDEQPVSKVTYEKMTDFKFIVAYDAYSKAWDNQQGIEQRRRLNGFISQLFNNEISYPHFYREINRYTGGPSGGQELKRTRIQGQRKRDYRRKEQRRSRQKRHKR